ncbi:hypothetical protein Metlim_2955 [Methanoplanus limicola DSM 2279]|uniref:Uncharacterized protein n=1 Tax=Methanoplanus limicola DSM 2279 TaxID=937775 RepID=H1YY53_9EURY|nr:hypothetical protein Metlim_2955 [Methanoplanus limicola DSM 2279]
MPAGGGIHCKIKIIPGLTIIIRIFNFVIPHCQINIDTDICNKITMENIRFTINGLWGVGYWGILLTMYIIF